MSNSDKHNRETIVILDFGSQYTQLIARRVREHKVFSVILPYNASLEEIRDYQPSGLILSGGPSNVYAIKAPRPREAIFDMGIPILGICYGLQVIAHHFKAKVNKTKFREFGFATLRVDKKIGIFKGLPASIQCWMSHGDEVKGLPGEFEKLGHTGSAPVAALCHKRLRLYGVQFHPEVAHTPMGSQIIKNFLYTVCGLRGKWTTRSFIEEQVERVQEQVGHDRVILGLSGGVDSSVAAALLHKALGKQLTSIFVDNGLLRQDEAKKVRETFRKKMGLNLRFIDAEEEFLKALKGVSDPERKRKIIGRLFIKIFQREANKIKNAKYLAQGTLYPDVIESVAVHGGPTSTIKSHHNVGGLPKRMKLKLVEPFRMLFKDEVRDVGRLLKIDAEIVGRQPFPGPGLAVRILGAVTKERCDLLRKADFIVIDEIKKAGIYNDIWQAFAVLLPVQSVGVMGDERTYENAVAVRMVESVDGMTADWAKVPYDVLGRISNRIINEVRGINRVCYDISSKPPATIEWE